MDIVGSPGVFFLRRAGAEREISQNKEKRRECRRQAHLINLNLVFVGTAFVGERRLHLANWDFCLGQLLVSRLVFTDNFLEESFLASGPMHG